MEVEDYFPEERAFLSDATYLKNCCRHHYTNIDSIIKILESKCLWLTHYSKKNDSSEGRYVLESIANKSKDCEKLVKALTDNFFLTSFSLYGNLLSQWRGYGEANIGFDYEGMKSDFCEIEDKSGITVETSGVIFSECEYLSKNDESFNKRADDIENRMKEIIKSNSSLSDQQYNYLSIGVTCFSIKHPGFREESESRIYSYLWNRGPFSHNTKQYIKLHFSPRRVRRVVIGPCEGQDIIVKRMEKVLSSKSEYDHVDLVRSTIPFIKKVSDCST